MIRKNKILTVAIHVLCWGLFISLPYLSATIRNDDFPRFSLCESVLLTLPSMLIFYADYSFLAGRFLLQKRDALMFIVCNIITIAICICLWQLIHEYISPAIDIRPRPHKPPIWEIISRSSISLALVGALGVALKSVEYIYVKRVELEQYEKEKIAAELQSLKMQLNPHFLFNSLNNIYALAAIDEKKTQSAIHDLSNLLRYVLYKSNEDTVPIESEINFIKAYCDLMKLRFDDSVNISINDNSASLSQKQISPMLFIVLVENAFKHGINPNGKSHITIEFSQEDEQTLCCTVSNGNFPKDSQDKSGSGIGIENLRKRLQYLYPDKYKYDTSVQNGIYTAKLTIVL